LHGGNRSVVRLRFFSFSEALGPRRALGKMGKLSESPLEILLDF
jgi:hypothetical protein